MSDIKKGDKVIIVNGAEVDKYRGQVFDVLSDPYMVCGAEVVKVKCETSGKYFGGGYSTDLLSKVPQQKVRFLGEKEETTVQTGTAFVDTVEGHSPKCESNGEIDSSERMYVNKYTIVFDGKSVADYPDEDEISLDEAMDIAKRNGFDCFGTLTVILETMLGGTIYQYGNYGESWVKHGTTNGLA